MTIRVSCVGDSITRAQHSVDLLGLLGARHRPGEVSTRRFGVNRDSAHDLLPRLDEVVAAPADVITVLIGTNDARASLPGYPVEKVMRSKRLPTEPSAAWFQECLGRVVDRLSSETDARNGLLSLPGARPGPGGRAGSGLGGVQPADRRGRRASRRHLPAAARAAARHALAASRPAADPDHIHRNGRGPR